MDGFAFSSLAGPAKYFIQAIALLPFCAENAPRESEASMSERIVWLVFLYAFAYMSLFSFLGVDYFTAMVVVLCSAM